MSSSSSSVNVSSSVVIPLWVELCGRLAPAAAIVVFAAPLPTIRQVTRDRSVGNLPLLPYSSMMASTFLWVTYGILKQVPKIWSPNGIGLLLSLYYFVSFIKYSPKAAPTLPGSIQQHVQGIGLVIVTTLILASIPDVGVQHIGTLGVLFCIAMFASPLAALKVVLQTKSAKAIPLPFTIASTVNCFLWSVAGLLDMHDVNIYLPNLLGLTFSLIQVALKLFYGNGPNNSKTELPM